MRLPWRHVALFVIALSVASGSEKSEKVKATRNVEITADHEKLRDPEGYEAIKELHRLMDDDQSGSIDRFESTDFLQEDLKLTGTDRTRRERAFHHDDEAITVDDMWESWFESEERNWDQQHLSEWLVKTVRLPQYEKNFADKKVTGVALPRMALQNSSYLANVLGIKNFVHRQKIQLKALDLVLFGFHEQPLSRIKDIAILVMTIVCIILGYYLTRLHKRSKQQMDDLNKKLSELSSMETDFEGAQKRFDGDVDGESVSDLKYRLQEAEKRLEMTESESVSFAIQPLLRRTYEIEIRCINEKKLDCVNEMREAKEFVDKMRKKQLGLMNSLKLATGATAAGADAVDAKVFALKQRMEKLKACMDECQQRWIEIESLCGFSITGYGAPPASLNGSIAKAMSSPKMSVAGSRKNSPPARLGASGVSPSFYLPNNPATASLNSESTVSSVHSAALKNELATAKSTLRSAAAPLAEDTSSLASSKSSSSIGRKLNNIFKRKTKV